VPYLLSKPLGSEGGWSMGVGRGARGWPLVLRIGLVVTGQHPPERIASALHQRLIEGVPGIKLMRG
jgi:hypothetical protein